MKKWVYSDDAWQRLVKGSWSGVWQNLISNGIQIRSSFHIQLLYGLNTKYAIQQERRLTNTNQILWTKQKSRFWSYFQGIWHPTDRFQAVTRVEGPLHQNVMTSPDKGSFWCFAIKPGFHFRSNWPRDQNALVGEPGEFSVLDMTADQETRSYTEKLWLANLGTSVPL